MNMEQLPKQRSACGHSGSAQANIQALEEGVTPLELCTRFWKLHTEIYEWVSWTSRESRADGTAGSS